VRILLDANILLYAVNKDCDRHRQYRDFVEKTVSGVDPWCLTWSIVYEFLRVSTHKSVFPISLQPDKAVDIAKLLLSSPALEILLETEKHEYFLEKTYQSAGPIRGNIFHDCHIAALMLEHDVKYIATADRHFRLFPFIKIVEPV